MGIKNFLNDLNNKLDKMFGKEDEVEVSVIEIDGVEYTELKRIEVEGKEYVFLADLENPKNFLVQHIFVENGKEYIDGLDSGEEFDNVMLQFSKEFTAK